MGAADRVTGGESNMTLSLRIRLPPDRGAPDSIGPVCLEVGADEISSYSEIASEVPRGEPRSVHELRQADGGVAPPWPKTRHH
jgi:hypothetical protein